jgi:dethiobiotin synthetase
VRPGVFITGTGTGVGKTFMCAATLLALRDEGIDAGYFKPVGTEALLVEGRAINPDAVWIKQLAGLPGPLSDLNPFCLNAPLAPLAASRLEDKPLQLPGVIKACRAAMKRHAFTVMEGAGGLLVPLCPGATVLDLIKASGLPALIAARGDLGTINHTLLSIRALQAAGVKVLGFCFTSPQPAQPRGKGQVSNSDLICEFSGVRFLGQLPWLQGDPPQARAILDAARSGLDIGRILAD